MAIELQAKKDIFKGIPMPVYIFSTMGDWKGQDKERKTIDVPGVNEVERITGTIGYLCDRNYADKVLELPTPRETPDGEMYPKALRYKCAPCAHEGKYTERPPKTHHHYEERREMLGHQREKDTVVCSLCDFVGNSPAELDNHMQSAPGHKVAWENIQAKRSGQTPGGNSEVAELRAQVQLLTSMLMPNVQKLAIKKEEMAELDENEAAPANTWTCGCKVNTFKKHRKDCPDAG